MEEALTVEEDLEMPERLCRLCFRYDQYPAPLHPSYDHVFQWLPGLAERIRFPQVIRCRHDENGYWGPYLEDSLNLTAK